MGAKRYTRGSLFIMVAVALVIVIGWRVVYPLVREESIPFEVQKGSWKVRFEGDHAPYGKLQAAIKLRGKYVEEDEGGKPAGLVVETSESVQLELTIRKPSRPFPKECSPPPSEDEEEESEEKD